MKKFLTKKINFAHAMVLVLALVVGIGTAGAVVVAPDDTIYPLIHAGQGDQVINNVLKIGNGSGSIGSLDVRGNSSSLAQFVGDSLFTVLTESGLALTSGSVFVGENAISSDSTHIWKRSYNLIEGTLAAVMQRVNVFGKLRATNLSNPSGTEKVCVEPDGSIVLCPPDSTETVTPINGACGSADGTTLSTAPTSNLCTTGTPSSVSGGTGTYDWSCYGSGGGTTASCSANQTVTYAWEEGGWGACTGTAATAGSCSGTYTTSSAGSCTGTYQDITKINWNGDPYNWNSSASYYTTNTSDDNTPSIDIGGVVVEGLNYWGSGACYRVYVGGDNTWKYDRYYLDDDQFGNWCLWDVNPMSTNNSLTNTSNPTGSVYSSTDQSCTGLSEQSCTTDQAYSGCSWNTSTTSNSCSSFDQSTCTSQEYDGYCSWNPGSSSTQTQTQTVVCKDSNGLTVADSFCPSPKPDESRSCATTTGTPYSCSSLGWGITSGDTCSPVDYDITTDFDLIVSQGSSVCSSNGVADSSCPTSGSGSSSSGTAVGATVWYCHLGQFNEQIGTTCDNENFPDGYMWGQQRVCTTATPTDAECESGPITSPSTADCVDTNNDGHWICTD